MHLIDVESGVAATTAIVGGGIPIAADSAYAGRLVNPTNVAVAFLGDGAASIGAFHEGISMARVWNLPAIFLVENNLYSVATTVEETVGFPDIVLRAAGQDMLGIIVDGMDTLAVREAVWEAWEPCILRPWPGADRGQDVSLPPPEREASRGAPTVTVRRTRKRSGCPGSASRARIGISRERGLLSPDQICHVRTQAAEIVAEAGRILTQVDRDGQLVVRPERMPRPEEAEKGVRGDLREL